jgi:regulator of nonsense transcripts 1
MEGAFIHLGNHLVSDSASTINAGDDESIFDLQTPHRRRQDDDETDVFDDDDDMESMASMTVDGARKSAPKAEEEVEVPPHACA